MSRSMSTIEYLEHRKVSMEFHHGNHQVWRKRPTIPGITRGNIAQANLFVYESRYVPSERTLAYTIIIIA